MVAYQYRTKQTLLGLGVKWLGMPDAVPLEGIRHCQPPSPEPPPSAAGCPSKRIAITASEKRR